MNNFLLNHRFKKVDDKANKFNSEIAVVVMAYHSQRPFLSHCLKSVRNIGWTILTYDNPGHSYSSYWPDDECIAYVDTFVMKHVTKEVPRPTYPQFWNFKHAIDILSSSNCKYVFTIGADSILENPSGINDIKLMLSDHDIISCSSNPDKTYCNTKSFLVRKSTFKQIMDFLETTYIPFHDIGNMEYRFGLAIKKLNIKEKLIPRQPHDNQFSYSYDANGNCVDRGTWGEILGYRHLGGEMKIRKQKNLRPIEEKYL